MHTKTNNAVDPKTRVKQVKGGESGENGTMGKKKVKVKACKRQKGMDLSLPSPTKPTMNK